MGTYYIKLSAICALTDTIFKEDIPKKVKESGVLTIVYPFNEFFSNDSLGIS